MVKGENAKLTLVEAREVAFAVTTVNVTSTLPDGTAGPSGAGTVDSASALNTHTLTSPLFSVSQAGEYKVNWAFGDGTNAWIRPEIRFGTVYDVNNLVRTKLQRPARLLPDVTIEAVYADMWRQIYASYPGLGTYNSISGDDIRLLEQGLVALTAIRARNFTPTSTPTGEIVGWKIQQTEYKFSAPNTKQQKTTEEVWFEEAYLALGQVSYIKALYASQQAAFHFMHLAGPTRKFKSEGHVESLFSVVIRGLNSQYTFDTGDIPLEWQQ